MDVEFKEEIMLHGFSEVKYRWEVGEVGRWERWKGNEVASWERRESGEVGKWESVFYSFMFVTLLFEIMYLLFRWSSSLTNFTDPNYKIFLLEPVLVINGYTSFLKMFAKIGVGISF